MDLLWTGPDRAAATFLLAHGAGAPMDSPFMNTIAEGLGASGFRVARFEFAYMAGRRSGGGRKPPPRAETLAGEFAEAVAALGETAPLFIGGKSMGGRVASMAADALWHDKRINGLICLGYPFHPPGSPEKLRTAHLETLSTPSLICQGTKDTFGARDEVAGYELSPAIEFHWLESGDHDFKPAKVTGKTHRANLDSAVASIAAWMNEHAAN